MKTRTFKREKWFDKALGKKILEKRWMRQKIEILGNKN